MFNKLIVSILVLLLCACGNEVDSEVSSEVDYYEFDFTNKEKTEKITLRFSNANVSRFPGWEHDRNRRVSVSLWYPSLLDAASPNVWMSKSEEQEKLSTKPNPEDRKINLRVGASSSNTILDPSMTLEEKTTFHCHIDGRLKKFSEDGQAGNFYRYKFTEETKPPRIHYLYHPIEKIKGIYCIKCNGTTCQLIGITDFGVSYTALESYVEGRMVDEAIEIHGGINEYLQNKVVTSK